ncbi:MAG TPA: tetratricopeptide repeat protein, partial [Roseiflexaceae bacterium]|nr:tetratricopeptide repeat protein [Roseiflexaceae bacterium]
RAVDAAAAESSEEETAQCQGLAAYAITAQSFFFASLGQFDKQISCLERSRAAVHQYGTPYEIATHAHMYASTRDDVEESRSLLEQALAMLREIGATWEAAYVINNMGHPAFARGETLEAKRYYEEALALFRASGEFQGTSDQLLDLGRVAYRLGNYDEGRRLLQESLAIQHVIGSVSGLQNRQRILGKIAYAQGQFAEAEARFRQELTIIHDLGYREPRSWCLSRLGAAVLAQERLGDAAGLLIQARTIAEDCSDPRGISRAHNQLGYLALKQGAPETARQHWRTAIDKSRHVQDYPHLLVSLDPQLVVTLDALMGLATLMTQAGDVEQAVEMLTLVRGAATIDRRTENTAEQLLAELEGRLSPDCFAPAQARGRVLELGTTVAAVLAEGGA